MALTRDYRETEGAARLRGRSQSRSRGEAAPDWRRGDRGSAQPGEARPGDARGGRRSATDRPRRHGLGRNRCGLRP